MKVVTLDTSDPSHKEKLLKLAEEALAHAYSPYTQGKIGAAIIGASGRIYMGASIGNACSTLNCCAEQAAMIPGVLVRDFPFRAIAVVQNSPKACTPCGRCLQLLSEFASDIPVLTMEDGNPVVWQSSYLLPRPFKRDHLP